MESQTPAQGRGRPTKYKPEFPDLLVEHFKEYLREPERQVVIGKKIFYKSGKVDREEYVYKPIPKAIPTVFAFSLKIDVAYSAVRDWGHDRIGDKPGDGEIDRRPYKYPEFAAAYKQVENFQKEAFNMVGIGGTGSAAFTIFAAKNMIGWRDDTTQRFIDAKGKDRATSGYILIPNRKTDDEAKQEYDEQQQDEGVASS